MPCNDSNRSGRRAQAALVLVGLLLAACGGSLSKSGASTAARTTASVTQGTRASTARATATAPASAPKSMAGRKPNATESLIGAVRECAKSKSTKKCTLPGGGGPVQHVHLEIPGGAHGQISPGAPSKGTAGAQAKVPTAPPPSTKGSQVSGTPGKDAFAKFAACLRASGISVPGSAGNASPEAKAAESKCLVYLDGGA